MHDATTIPSQFPDFVPLSFMVFTLAWDADMHKASEIQMFRHLWLNFEFIIVRIQID